MVSPSIANGVVALVVNVAFVGYGGWDCADQATDHPKLNSKTINNAFKTFAFIILLLVFLRPIKLNQFATQPFNFFLQLHVVSRGELARQGVHLFFEQVFDRFPDAGEAPAVDPLYPPQRSDRGPDGNGTMESTVPVECAVPTNPARPSPPAC
jgi:hypothetical protein